MNNINRFTFIGLFMFFNIAGGICQTREPMGELLTTDTIKFTPKHNWITINNPESGIWQIGQPVKNYFNSGYNGSRSIITDSAGFYYDNCNDYFYITLPWSENYWGEGILSFYHKYDTDTLTDGGVIEMSYDIGDTWINILDDNQHIDEIFFGLYEDTIIGGEFGFSGKSDGWQYVELYWWWAALVKKAGSVLPGSPMIRFRFVSDAINTYKEGWMIDNIVFRGYSLMGAIKNISREEFGIFPVPAKDFVHILIINEHLDNLNFSVYELTGRQVKTQQLLNHPINVSDIKPGAYIYRIYNNKNLVKMGKLVKL